MIADYETPAAVSPPLSPPSDAETPQPLGHTQRLILFMRSTLAHTGERISTNQRACLCLFPRMEEDARPLLESVEPTNE